MNDDVRFALELWPRFNEAQRADAAQRMRSGMVAMARRNLGARTDAETRAALELVIAGCQAALDDGLPGELTLDDTED